MQASPTSPKPQSFLSIHLAQFILAGFIITAVLIILGNGWFVASVFTLKKKSRTRYDYAKASLAIADAIGGVTLFVFNIPNLIWSLDTTGPKIKDYNEFVASHSLAPKVAIILLHFNYSSSVYHILYATVNKFIAIKWPFQANVKSTKQIFFHLAAVWSFSALATLPMWFPEARIVYQSELFSYMPTFDIKNVEGIVILTVGTFLLIVPYIAMTILTFVILYVLHFSNKKSQSMRRSGNSRKVETNFWTTMALMHLGFTLTVVPLLALVFLDIRRATTCTNGILHFVLNFIATMSGLVNVTIYSFRDRRFRHRTKTMFYKLGRINTS
ncbi:unnamed protein product [Clavelina lepadiformis]|uniref:G-protein coupled receptors family 1 profile domain-containing protein n=1 Tax=Clavelina lepadiformis TaxID=159417 RepID=A0ABP0GSK9_CLALP